MEVILKYDGSFLVRFEPEEQESFNKIHKMFKDCPEKLDRKVNLEETLKEIIETGICWLS